MQNRNGLDISSINLNWKYLSLHFLLHNIQKHLIIWVNNSILEKLPTSFLKKVTQSPTLSKNTPSPKLCTEVWYHV